MGNGRIPYSSAPELTQERKKQLTLHWKIRDKEITEEEAIKQGYVEPKDDLFGMSQLMRDE